MSSGYNAAYEVVGDGRALVLVHGLGNSGAIWTDLRERLATRFTIVTYDLRGAGPRSEPEENLSLDTWVQDLRDLVERLELEHPVLIGHSLGASVVIKYALLWPDGAAGLVLMGADANLAQLGPRMRAAAELVRSVGLAKWVDDYWSKNPPFSELSRREAPEIFTRYREMLLSNNEQNYVGTCLAIANAENLTPRLSKVSLPALVIGGGADDRTPPEASRNLAARLPLARLVELPDVGHTMALEAPDAVAATIVEFVDSPMFDDRTALRSNPRTLDSGSDLTI